jgi:FkbM family methyltransferase
MKEFLKSTGYFALKNLPPSVRRYVPQGVDLYLDLLKLGELHRPKVIFDVGANQGQTALKLVKWFPEAAVHCFEPVASTRAKLAANTRHYRQIHIHPEALAAETGKAEIRLLDDDSKNTLDLHASDAGLGKGVEQIALDRLDNVMDRLGIERIHLLKIDTEGHDLEVLKGASKALAEERIDFVQVEAGMNPFNDRHVPFEDFYSYLKSYNYLCFGFYDQHLEWSGERRLRFANPAFVRPGIGQSKA